MLPVDQLPAGMSLFLNEPVCYLSYAFDMLALGCGCIVNVTDHRQRPFQAANLHMHMQGSWRVLYKGKLLVGKQDWREEYRGSFSDMPKLVQKLEQLTQWCLRHKVFVKGFDRSPWGDITVMLSSHLTIQAFSDSYVTDDGEYLRWFQRIPDIGHYILYTNRPEVDYHNWKEEDDDD